MSCSTHWVLHQFLLRTAVDGVDFIHLWLVATWRTAVRNNFESWQFAVKIMFLNSYFATLCR